MKKQQLVDKPYEITWQELKDFINQFPEEYLTMKVPVMFADENPARYMNEPFFIQEDVYVYDGDWENSGDLKVLKEVNEDFDENLLQLVTKKGTPFLWID